MRPLTRTAAIAQDAAVDNADGSGNDIIVTARRSKERLQDLPIVATALTAQDLERENIDDLGDIANKTVGFAFESFTAPLTEPTNRGQTNLRTTSPVQNVSTNLNGIYIQRSSFVDQGCSTSNASKSSSGRSRRFTDATRLQGSSA